MPASQSVHRIDTASLDQLIDEITGDAYGEDEQLWALQQALDDSLQLPARATVVGEPVELRSIDFDGNPLRGLTAECVRKKQTYTVSVLDLELPPSSPGVVVLAAYRRWLGAPRSDHAAWTDSSPSVPPQAAPGDELTTGDPTAGTEDGWRSGPLDHGDGPSSDDAPERTPSSVPRSAARRTTTRRGRSHPADGPRSERHAIYQLKVKLSRTKPPIWRRLLVPASWNLKRLHGLIQVAMGWADHHAHQFVFEDGECCYSNRAFELDAEDESEAQLRRLIVQAGESFLYEYDFGDGWEHEIVLEKILAPRDVGPTPMCIAGKLACPPEDCGGPWGYYELLDALEDPQHERHEELRTWIGGGFDPNAFDIDEVNEQLSRLP